MNFRYLRSQLVRLAIVLVCVSFFTFLLVNLLPGDPARTILGTSATEENIRILRSELGLDDPLPVRYLSWLGDTVTGDLGESYRSKQPVTEMLGGAVPVSLELMALSIILALAVAIPLGILTAYRSGGIADRAVSAVAFGLLAIPTFMLGIVLILIFSLHLGWFPAADFTRLSENIGDNLNSMVLPVLTLAAAQIAVYMRLLRTEMITTLQEDFITMARAKGMPTRHILLRHAFRPSSLPLLTVIGVNIGTLIGGAVIVENIYSMPGVGQLLVKAILGRDYLVVQGAVLVVAVVFVVVNFLIDFSYALLDPRIRHGRALA